MIRTVIVDDEPLARRAVAALVGAEPDFEIVAEAGDGRSAAALIMDTSPDLVFLDIQMPGVTGFDVIEAVGADAMPLTVFVTAFDAHAVHAFEVQAFDYILKPFDDLRMARVLERVRRQLDTRQGRGERLRSLLGEIGVPRLVARSHGKAELVRLDEVDWIGAAGDYAEVHAGEGAYLLNESLASLEARLPKPEFARIHRSVIVRLDRLAKVRPGTHGDGIVQLACGAELRFSRRYREPIDAFLKR